MACILSKIGRFFKRFFSEYKHRKRTKPNYKELYSPHESKGNGNKE